MLEQVGLYNDLSDELRKKLEDRVVSFGDQVQYRFDISHPNPDPQKYNGETIWPSNYTLDPKTFMITDADEKRPNKSKIKRIGLVDKIDPEKGHPISFHKIMIRESQYGVLTLTLTNPEDFQKAMFIELHPKHVTGMFYDKNSPAKIQRIDAYAEAKEKRDERSERRKALKIVDDMKETGVREFAAAMLWDHNADITILRDKMEEYAESQSAEFNKLMTGGKKLKYQALVKMALDRGDLVFEPLEYKFMWRSGEVMAILTEVADKNHVESAAQWLVAGDERSVAAAKKLEGLTAK